MNKTLISIAFAALFAGAVFEIAQSPCSSPLVSLIEKKSHQAPKRRDTAALVEHHKAIARHARARVPAIAALPLRVPAVEPTESLALQQITSIAVPSETAWHIIGLGLNETDAIIKMIDGHYLVSLSTITELRLDPARLTTINGLAALDSVGQITTNEQNATLTIATNPALLPITTLDLGNQALYLPPAPYEGSFLNYNLHSQTQQSTQPLFSGLFEGNTFVAGMRLNAQALGQSIGTAYQRIAANLSREDAATATTWSIGDGQSVAGTNVAPVNFVGLQYKKDYSLAPGFITSPLYNFSGTATAPSTIDVLVGNQVVRSQQVAPGPFEISNLIPQIGANSASIVVRNIFGQQQVINASVIGNPAALAAGLSDYSVQSGQVRYTLATTESTFASGFYKQGVTNSLTLEGNCEASTASPDLPAVTHAGGSAVLSTAYGNFSAGGRVGSGNSAQVGYQNSWRFRNWLTMLNSSIAKTSSNYLQLGGGVVSPLTQIAQVSVQHGKIGMNALFSESNGVRMTNIGLVLSPSTAGGVTYSINGINTSESGSGASASSTLLAMASIQLENSGNRASSIYAGYNNTTIPGESINYSNRPLDGLGATVITNTVRSSVLSQQDAELDYRAYSFDSTVATSTVNSITAERASITGAIAFDRGQWGATRHIDQGFALIDSAAPNAVVQLNGVPSAQADSKGYAFLSGISPFLKNRISLDANTVPDNFDDTELTASTYRKSGAYLSIRPTVVTGEMVQIPGHTTGVFTVSETDYPITDRGAWIELPPGDYIGTTNGQSVNFTINEVSK